MDYMQNKLISANENNMILELITFLPSSIWMDMLWFSWAAHYFDKSVCFRLVVATSSYLFSFDCIMFLTSYLLPMLLTL